MLYKNAMIKLVELNECSMDIEELNKIRTVLASHDIQCLDISLLNIETLWYKYSDDYMASCLVVNNETITEFIWWLN